MNIIDAHFPCHVLANSVSSEEVKYLNKLSPKRDTYLSFEEIHALLFPNVAHCRFVNKVQSTRIRLVVVRLDNLL